MIPPFSAIYDVNPPRGKMVAKFSYEGERIAYRAKTTHKGLLALLVGGEVKTESIAEFDDRKRYVPQHYTYTIDDRPDDSKNYRFDHQRKRVSMRYDGKVRSVPLVDDVLDENLLILQIARDAKRWGSTLDKDYNIADKGRIKIRRFTALRTEVLDTSLGRIEALRVERRKRGKIDRILWLSPAHHFLPIKINIIKDGRVKETLSLVEFNTTHIEP